MTILLGLSGVGLIIIVSPSSWVEVRRGVWLGVVLADGFSDMAVGQGVWSGPLLSQSLIGCVWLGLYLLAGLHLCLYGGLSAEWTHIGLGEGCACAWFRAVCWGLGP